jgi:hypothetical protein
VSLEPWHLLLLLVPAIVTATALALALVYLLALMALEALKDEPSETRKEHA